MSNRYRKLDQTLGDLVVGLAIESVGTIEPVTQPTLAVVIPAYNEADGIVEVLRELPDDVLGLRVEPIVVVDGGTDDTAAVARAAGFTTAVHPVNRGQGDALRTGFAIALAREADGRVVMIEGAIPGERVEVELTTKKKSFARGHVTAVLEPSPDRVTPPCEYVAAGCGGCEWQHIAPDAQRRLRRDVVVDALTRLGKVPDADALHAEFVAKGATIAREICDQPYGCRDFDVLDCNGYRLCFGQNLL